MSAHAVDLDSCMFEAMAAATEAGDEIKAAWHVERDVEYKGDVDLVTATDKKCEDLIFERLRGAFATHAFVGEESVAADNGQLPPITDAPTWFVDPLDGTTNFVHGYPFSCVSIGLTLNKVPVLGVVLNPITGETFAAVQGRGATLNGEPISVSKVDELNKALIATEIGVGRDEQTVDAIMTRVRRCVENCRSLRSSGSCAMNMCGVACGRLDAFYEIGFGGPWDCVGACVIVREAGGLVMDPSGSAFSITGRRVLCGNPQVATKLAQVLVTVPDGPQEPKAPGASGE
ncbi:inositol monophosphatase [bacterium]|nr:inositol monophosphatase [bacterium]